MKMKNIFFFFLSKNHIKNQNLNFMLMGFFCLFVKYFPRET